MHVKPDADFESFAVDCIEAAGEITTASFKIVSYGQGMDARRDARAPRKAPSPD
jgi:hypothetical protein